MKCPHCGYGIPDKAVGRYLGRKGGTATTAAKASAARNNGRLGGRPRKERNKPEEE